MTVRGVSFSAVEAMLAVTTPMLGVLLHHMELKLSDVDWLRNNVRNKSKNPTFIFTHAGDVSEDDKRAIEKLFHENGWEHVEVRNSSENGEAPGMIGVTIARYKRTE
jgi:hypothetical protein